MALPEPQMSARTHEDIVTQDKGICSSVPSETSITRNRQFPLNFHSLLYNVLCKESYI